MMKLVQDFFDRIEVQKCDTARAAFTKAVLASPDVAGQPDSAKQDLAALIEGIWADAQNGMDINYPENLMRYTLTVMTQSRWKTHGLHFAYARQMMGTPDQPWRLESGIVAVYENVVAPHYLKPDMVAFVAEQGSGAR